MILSHKFWDEETKKRHALFQNIIRVDKPDCCIEKVSSNLELSFNEIHNVIDHSNMLIMGWFWLKNFFRLCSHFYGKNPNLVNINGALGTAVGKRRLLSETKNFNYVDLINSQDLSYESYRNILDKYKNDTLAKTMASDKNLDQCIKNPSYSTECMVHIGRYLEAIWPWIGREYVYNVDENIGIKSLENVLEPLDGGIDRTIKIDSCSYSFNPVLAIYAAALTLLICGIVSFKVISLLVRRGDRYGRVEISDALSTGEPIPIKNRI